MTEKLCGQEMTRASVPHWRSGAAQYGEPTAEECTCTQAEAQICWAILCDTENWTHRLRVGPPRYVEDTSGLPYEPATPLQDIAVEFIY